MARRRRGNYKNATAVRGRRRRRRSRAAAGAGSSSEEEDEEYIAGEEDFSEEDEEEIWASSREDSEEEFEFGESSSGDEDEEEDLADEDAEFSISKKKGNSRDGGKKRGRKGRVSVEKEVEVVVLPMPAVRVTGKRGRKGRVSVEKDRRENEDCVGGSRRRGRNSGGSVEEEIEEDGRDSEDCIGGPRRRTRKSRVSVQEEIEDGRNSEDCIGGSRRRTRKSRVSVEEDGRESEDCVGGPRRRARTSRVLIKERESEDCIGGSRRARKSVVSDEEEVSRIGDCIGWSKRRRNFKVSDDEEEDLVVLEKQEKEEEEGIRSRRKRSRLSVYEEGDEDEMEDENDEDFAPDEEDCDEDELILAPRRNRKVDRDGNVSEDENDEDFVPDEEEELISMPRRRRKEDQDGTEDEDDVDFAPDEEDFDEELILMPRRRQKEDLEVGRRKRKVRTNNRGKKRRQARSDEEDEDFIVDSLDEAGNRRKKNKNARKKSWSEKELESEASEDYEHVTSDDDDFMQEDQVALAEERKRINNMGKKRRKRYVVGSSEESSSEEDMRDLVVEAVAIQPKPEKSFVGRKGEQKGKEKESGGPCKQVCGICLSEEQKSTTRGVLNCCEHYFCFTCIMEWSKVESRCPLCKRRFETVTNASSDSGFTMRKSVIRVQKRDQVYQPSEEEIRRMLDPYENVVCMECQQGGDDSVMLLCDICDSSAHTYCVGLGREVPEGNWYCECCRSVNLSYPPSQENLVNQGTSSSDILNHGNGPNFASRHYTMESQRSVALPDLNASPSLDEDHVAMSQTYGGGAFTVSSRRAIHNRIRILLSNGRSRPETDVQRRHLINDFTNSMPERNGPSLCESEQMNNSNGATHGQTSSEGLMQGFFSH